MNPHIIALDQGTTSSRAIVFNAMGAPVSVAQYPFEQLYPRSGWVEHDPLQILATEKRALSDAFRSSGLSRQEIAAIGITNQRETTVLWDRRTGRPIYNAIVWQCRRTAKLCEELTERGLESVIREKTGLLIDAYFSATKILWLLDNVPGARERAERGELLFGTVESWLIWNLTGGAVHVTDVSNAGRTMLFNIHTLRWDEELCRELNIPLCILPTVVPNSMEYGRIAAGIPGLEELAGVPICGSAGDQQAALLGQGCIHPGDTKNTYGTGCFTMMNTGSSIPVSSHGLVTCVGWQLGERVDYCLEGSVFNAGSTVQWLRDELGLISTAAESEELALSVPDNGGVYLVSAFTGLGAPHWDMYARGAAVGLTRGSTKAHLVRAGLEGIAYQVRDLILAMEQDAGAVLPVLKVDGGASVNRFLMQFQSDILQKPIDRPLMVETTALGAAFLAGLAAGVWSDPEDILALRRSAELITPRMEREEAQRLCRGWERAVERSVGWAEE